MAKSRNKDMMSGATGLASKLNRAAKGGTLPAAETRPSRRFTSVNGKVPNWRERHASTSTSPTAPVTELEPTGQIEEDWTASGEEPTEADVLAAMSDSLSAREVTDADLDNLWDWVRADDDRGRKFLGVMPSTSKDLRARVGEAFGREVFALIEDGPDGRAHIGFGGFSPITDTHVGVHLYFAPTSRGRLPQLVPQLLRLAAGEYPGKTLMAQTDDVAAARMYRSFGFTLAYVLTYTPRPTEVESAPEGEVSDDAGVTITDEGEQDGS